MRYFRNGQELGSVEGELCSTCYRNVDTEGMGHSDTCPDRKRSKEVSAESIMPMEIASYMTGAYGMNSVEREREQRNFRAFLALKERERTLTRMEPELIVYEHHQDGQLVCCLCGAVSANGDDFTAAPCGVIARGPERIGAVGDACTEAPGGALLLDAPIVGED